MWWAILKNPKVIVSGILAITLLGAGYYFSSVLQKNNELESQVKEYEASVENYQSQLQDQNETIEEYLQYVKESEQQQESLKRTLAEAQGEIQRCLQMEVPEDVLDRVFDYD